jgi:hypothetical protein
MSSRIVGVVRGKGLVAAASAVVGIALTSAVAAAPAGAQYRAAQALQRPVNYVAGVGATVPTGNAGRALGTGWNVLAGVTVNGAALPVGLRASASYQRFAAKIGSADSITTISEGYGDLLGATLAATLDLPSGVVRPYVMLGGGYYALRARRSVQRIVRDPGGDFLVETTERESDGSWGVSGGVGMRGGLGALDAFVELRVDNVFTTDGAFGAKQLRVLPLSVGVRF